MGKSALIAGASGLIGKQLLELLLNNDSYEKVRAITRKPLPYDHDKYENLIVDFDDLAGHVEVFKGDHVFCCLGTTMKVAGSKEKFRKVDYKYPLELARISEKQGAKSFLLVSALGADKNSSVFYNKVKGEVETAIADVGFESFHVFRPSLLIGPRTEKRFGERLAQVIMSIVGFLFIGSLKKYKAIESLKVARAMMVVASKGKTGQFFYESDKLQYF